MQNLGNMLFRIRNMVEEDIPGVACLEQQASSPWSSDSLAEEVQHDRGVVLVAQLQGDPGTAPETVGWCACRYIVPEAELLRIVVDRHFRRSGVATSLLRHLLLFLCKINIEILFLEVRAHNQNALKFYTKSGFVPIGERLGYYTGPDDDALLLQKLL